MVWAGRLLVVLVLFGGVVALALARRDREYPPPADDPPPAPPVATADPLPAAQPVEAAKSIAPTGSAVMVPPLSAAPAAKVTGVRGVQR